MIRQKIVANRTPPLPSNRETHRPNAVFSAWPASSNQDAHGLSDAGIFYTGVVLYKQKPYYYKKKYFLENPANKKIVLLQEKRTTQTVSFAVLF